MATTDRSAVETSPTRARSTLIDHIQRVDLRVRDVGASLGFYRDVVGLQVVDETGERSTLRSAEGPVFLTLSSEGVTGAAERSATGLFHIAIRFPDRASLGDALARLVDARLEIGAGDHGVSEALYVDDPDGNGVELYRDRPRDEWPAPPASGGLVAMTTGPVDLESVLGEGRDVGALGQAAAAGTDMGHVHLQVSDVEQTIRFYAEELGLDLTQRFGGEAAFLSSNGYHHHIGANTWNSRGGATARADRAGLERIVFAVDGEATLERLRLRLGEYGRSVEGDEGRSVLVRDPDGIQLEFVIE